MLIEDEKRLGEILKDIVQREINFYEARIHSLTISALTDKSDNELMEGYKRERKLLTEHLKALNG